MFGINLALTSSIHWIQSIKCWQVYFRTKLSIQQSVIMKLVWLFIFVVLSVSTSRFSYSIAPCNLYPTPNIKTDNISWLYEALADSWIKLGLPEDTRQSIENGAFYTTLIRRGLRLIALNMNYCTSDNYWLVINSTDPLGQLQWVRSFFEYMKIRVDWFDLVNSMVTICRGSWRESPFDWSSTTSFMYGSIQLEF